MKATLTEYDIYGQQWHPKLLPAGYKKADTLNCFRIPQVNDTFLSPKGEVCTLHVGDVVPKGPRVILTKVADPTPLAVYKTNTPKMPSGFQLGNFEKVDKSSSKVYLSVDGYCDPAASWNVGGTREYWRYELLPATPVHKYKVGELVNWAGETYKPITIPKQLPGLMYEVKFQEYANPQIHEEMYFTPHKPPTPPVPAPKFKVGDKVWCGRAEYKGYGVGTVTKVREDAAPYPFVVDWVGSSGVPDAKGYLHCESELIPVPTIAGYEVVDYRLPKAGEEYLYSEYNEVQRAYADHRAAAGDPLRFILKPVAPKTTHGFKVGDSVKRRNGGLLEPTVVEIKGDRICVQFDDDSKGWRDAFEYEAVPTLPTPLSVYGTATPKAPEGYRLGEFKALDKADKFFLCNGGHNVLPVLSYETFGNTYRYTLIPLPKPTRWLIEVESETKPEIADLWVYGPEYYAVRATVLSVSPKPTT